jgi:5-methylcytosine-specific restriction endonuclease McrA
MNAKRKVQYFDLLEDYESRILLDPSLILFKEKAELEKQRISDFLHGLDHKHSFKVYCRIASNGVRMYKNGCDYCGYMDGRFIPYRELSEFQKRNSPNADTFDRSPDLWGIASETYRQLWRPAYTAYLESESWKELRQKVFRRDGYVCKLDYSGCNGRAEQAHHLTYARIGREDLEDLLSVCIPCHGQLGSSFDSQFAY